MPTAHSELIDLENRFWQSLVEEDTDTSVSMLDEPSMMVSSHGAMQFDRAKFREMAEQGCMVVKSYELSDVQVAFPTDTTAVVTYRVRQSMAERGKSAEIQQEMADSSVWTKKNGQWLCSMHTETPIDSQKP